MSYTQFVVSAVCPACSKPVYFPTQEAQSVCAGCNSVMKLNSDGFAVPIKMKLPQQFKHPDLNALQRREPEKGKKTPQSGIKHPRYLIRKNHQNIREDESWGYQKAPKRKTSPQTPDAAPVRVMVTLLIVSSCLGLWFMKNSVSSQNQADQPSHEQPKELQAFEEKSILLKKVKDDITKAAEL